MDRTTSFVPQVSYRVWYPGYDTGDVSPAISRSNHYEYLSAYNKGKFVPGVFRCNPVSIYDYKLINSPFGFARTGPTGPNKRYCESWGEIGGAIVNTHLLGSNFSWPTSSSPKDLAIIQAFAKLNSPETFDGGVFLAELAETIAMLRNPFQGLTKLLRSRRFRDPKKLSKAGADTWMEFRYGMRPFVSDIASIAATFMAKSLSSEKRLLTKRSGVKDEENLIFSGGATPFGYHNYYYQMKGSFARSYTCGISYYKKVGVPNLAYSLGVSVEHLPSILWEKIPLSFVADWFYSTGDWLRAIQPNPTIQKLGGYVSTKTYGPVHLNVTRVTIDGVDGYVSATADYEMSQLVRTCNPSLPALPVRRIATLSLAHVIDSVILIAQRIPTAWKQALSSFTGRRR